MKLSAGGIPFYARKMTRIDAETVCGWRYEGTMEVYNIEDSSQAVEEFFDGCHFALSERFGGQVNAFVNFGERATLPLKELENIYRDESYTDMALGLMPEKCGKGLGKSLVLAAMELCSRFFPEDGFRVTVAKNNTPAMRIYRGLGFETIAEFTAEIIYPDKAGKLRTRKTAMEILAAPPEVLEKHGKFDKRKEFSKE